MECGLPVNLLRRLSLMLLLSALALAAQAASNGTRELVLVASADSPASQLSVRETRKLYLGVPVEKNGVTIKPLLNVSDSLLFEVFLQKVTFMSAEAYDKQVLAIVFRLGGQRPEVFRDRGMLFNALRERPETVTFVWSSDLQGLPGLKSVSTLWSGDID